MTALHDINGENRALVNAFLKEHWYATTMVLRGEILDMTRAEGFFLEEDGAILALLTYRFDGGVFEILSLDSLRENEGLGTRMVDEALRRARELNAEKMVVITSNDNMRAMAFYQKRGFDLVRLYRNGLEAARRLKPDIPLVGRDDIPLRHELECERILEG